MCSLKDIQSSHDFSSGISETSESYPSQSSWSSSTSSTSLSPVPSCMTDLIASTSQALYAVNGSEFEDACTDLFSVVTTSSMPASALREDIASSSSSSPSSSLLSPLSCSPAPSPFPPSVQESTNHESAIEDRSFAKNDFKTKKYRKDRSELLRTLPPCRVCREAASGFHYGVNTCEACKGFFRRALKHHSTFKCKQSENCDVTGLWRTLCSYCRYQKCLEVGMSKHAIKVGRYTHEARTRNIIEVKLLSERKCKKKDTPIREYAEPDEDDSEHVVTDEDVDKMLRFQQQLQQEQQPISTSIYLNVQPKDDDDEDEEDTKPENRSLMPVNLASSCRRRSSTASSEHHDQTSSSSEPASLPPKLLARIHMACRETRDCYQDALIEEHISLMYQYQKMNVRRAVSIPQYLKPSVDAKLDMVIKDMMDAHNNNIIVSTYFPDSFISDKIRSYVKECRARQKTFGPSPDIPEDEYVGIYQNTGIDVDGRVNLVRVHSSYFEMFLRGLIRFAKSLPGFRELPLHDQAELVKAARVDFWYLGAYRGFNSDLNTACVPNGQCFHRTEFYKMFDSGWVDGMFEIANRLKEHSFKPEVLIVIKAFLFTMTDRCTVTDVKGVDNVQNLLIACLDHLLKRFYPKKDHASLMGEALNQLTILRPLSRLEEQNRKKPILMHFYSRKQLIKEIVLGFDPVSSFKTDDESGTNS